MKLTNNLYFYPEKGMLDCNTYVVRDAVTVLIDPGSDQYLPMLMQELRQDGIGPEDIDIITNTHLHLDHYGANEAIKGLSGAKILAHPLHREYYNAMVIEVARFFGIQPIEFTGDGYLEDGRLQAGDIELELIPAPGHSPDSVCFYCREQGFLVCGDVVFYGSTGRVDLPGGSADELKQSINGLSRLDIQHLLPGHMDFVAGAEKVKVNFELVREHIFPWL